MCNVAFLDPTSSQVFTLTVVFGLFHGVVLLPVILSLLGPSGDDDDDYDDDDDDDPQEARMRKVAHSQLLIRKRQSVSMVDSRTQQCNILK